jgi:hypothetical protein
MIKHVGKHNDKKILLLFREVPNESHMCLVVYSDLLPRAYHDDLMKLVESPAGQESKSFSDLLHRSSFSDGNNCLMTLHKSGWIKKVRTDQVRIVANARSSIMLNELNKILNEMETGEAAQKQMADIVAGQNKSSEAPIREVGMPAPELSTSSSDGVLSDSDLAKDRVQQAERMKANAARLLAEAETLMLEAAELDPSLKNVQPKPTAKKASAKSKKD